jgi:hypothetical protein
MTKQDTRLDQPGTPWWRPGVVALFVVAFLSVLDLFFGGLAAVQTPCAAAGSCPSAPAFVIAMRVLLVATPTALVLFFVLPRRPAWQWPRLALAVIAVLAAGTPLVAVFS